MSATSPDHAVASEVLTAHKLRITHGPTIEELYNQGPHLAAYTYERGYHKLDAESGYEAELEFRDYGEHFNWRASNPSCPRKDAI